MTISRPTVAHIHRIYLNLTENWIYNQVRFLRAVRSIFVAKRPANRDQFPWDPVYLLWDRPRLEREWNRVAYHLLGYYPLYRRICRAEGVDLLHAHSGVQGVQSLRLAESLGLPLLTSFYGYELTVHRKGDEGLRRMYQALFSHGAACIAEGPAARQRLIELGCPPERAWIHRLGLDMRDYPLVERRPADTGRLRVLMAARFDEKKGLPYGMEAFCRVARHEPGLELTVVGDASEAPEQQRIKRELYDLVRRYDVQDRVRFTGFLPVAELRGLALDHELLLHPSVRASNGDSEGGHPVVLTEMAATGMPIIATWHCDIPEVVVDGETGWLCTERNVEELEAALADAWARRADFPAIGRRARVLVETKYDGRANTLDSVYLRVLGAA